MASTNKTPQLGLNQWEPGDDVLREDFNADNRKIDGLATASVCTKGSFIGDGIYPKVVNLGFRPCFLIAYTHCNVDDANVYIVPDTGNGVLLNGKFNSFYHNERMPIITDTGFTILGEPVGNLLGKSFEYIAFR